MTNEALLQIKINESGFKMSYIAEKLGITRQALYNKITNRAQFMASEMFALKTILSLSWEEAELIFFNPA